MQNRGVGPRIRFNCGAPARLIAAAEHTSSRRLAELELKQALKEQYRAGLAMLADCVEKCPDDLWVQGEHPRSFWRIAWHAAYFAHNYLVQDAETFNGSVSQWPRAVRTGLGVSSTQRAIDVEPYELAEEAEPVTRQDLLEYIRHIESLIDPVIARLDLESDDTGFPWYPNMSKLSHELMNLRHIQGHVGQLSERLMARGVDTDWIAKIPRTDS